METLPVEIVEIIAQQLKPQDLARCSAVSRKWREIFNMVWMWKPHCDPELEEPLRTIPCVATPMFVAPEAEDSTLSPISRWKLAFMRETHLWRNWRKEEIMNKKKIIIEPENNQVENVDFVTDTLVVVWYSNKIEIIDVSVVPATVAAKTDTSVHIHRDDCRVNGTNMLLVIKDYSIEVFNVDIEDNSIKLKHNIYSVSFFHRYDLKEDFFIFSTQERSKLEILNLVTGEILKEEPCPFAVNQNEIVKFDRITSSPTCDFVAVDLELFTDDGNAYRKYYIYSPKELTFLPGPVADHIQIRDSRSYDIALHGVWLALIQDDCNNMTVVNFQTRDVILNCEVIPKCEIFQCFDGFVFLGYEENKSCIKYYCPVDRTLATVYVFSDLKYFKIINNKFITIFDRGNVSESVLKLSGRTVEKCDISVVLPCKINRSCTRVLGKDFGDKKWYVNCLW